MFKNFIRKLDLLKDDLKNITKNNLEDTGENIYLEDNLSLNGYPDENIVLAIDVSGSMGLIDYPPSRLGAAKDSAMEFVKEKYNNNPKANIGVVEFSHVVKVVSDIKPVGFYLGNLNNPIYKLKVDGGTNINIGLSCAFSLLKNSNGSRRIILLTDGFGGSPIRLSKDIKDNGIIIQIIGIGGSSKDVNELLLNKIASVINGEIQYRFIGDKNKLMEHFRKLAGNITK